MFVRQSSVSLAVVLATVASLHWHAASGQQQPSSAEAVFPPVRPARLEGSPLPVGHMKPLGWQKDSDGPITEYTEDLHPLDFWQKHVSINQPAVLRGHKKDEAAFKLWTDEYMRTQYADQHVRVELKQENRSFGAWRMTLPGFLDRYTKENIYAVTVLPEAMRHEVKVPTPLLCGTFRKYLQELNLWIGYTGTRSVLHYDADHNIHCLLAGRKDFIMIDRKYEYKLGFGRRPSYVGSGYSKMNPDKVDLIKFPGAVDAPWTHTTLLPGDCIYIPGGYIHQVRGYGRTISETLLFTPFQEEFELGTCTAEDLKYTTLKDVSIYWTYLGGDSDIEMGYMNPLLLRDLLISGMEERGYTVLTQKNFVDLFFSQSVTANAQGDPVQVFDTYVDVNKTGVVSKEAIMTLPVANLKEIARNMDAAAVSRKLDPTDVKKKSVIKDEL